AGQQDLSELPRERIGAEFDKLLLDSLAPSWGLEVMRAMGALRFFPELAPLIGCPQDPAHHPEGDVWIHTLLALDAAARLRPPSERPKALMLAVLCHDLGKPATPRLQDGRLKSHAHETAGEDPTRAMLARVTAETKLTDEVLALVRHHLAPM